MKCRSLFVSLVVLGGTVALFASCSSSNSSNGGSGGNGTGGSSGSGTGGSSGSGTGGSGVDGGGSGGAPIVGTGKDYEICTNPTAQAKYLKSPWTYTGLTSGSKTYTVTQYKALPGYGTSLPPLPPYIANEPGSTDAAVIYAPGASVNQPAYNFPLTPLLYFFEGGSYGSIGFDSVPGDVFMGGSASGFPEPQFNGGRVNDQNGHWDFSGGGSTLAASASAGSTTITTKTAIGGYISKVNFPDGTSYDIANNSGTSITLSSGLTSAESAGTAVWANVLPALGQLSAAAAPGDNTVKTGPLPAPVFPWERFNLGATDGHVESIQVSQATGSPTSGYTLTLRQPVSEAAGAKAPVYYAGPAGDVTVEYLDIGKGGGNTTFWVSGGSGWTIEHNNVHDNYAGGANYKTTSSSGTAINGGDHSVIEYNCFQHLGEYVVNGGGTGSQFDYNQVDGTPYQPDLSGNGQSGCGKWWGSTNCDVSANAFTNEGYSVCLWFDNGNTGMLVQKNYFYNIGDRAIQNETGFNSEYIGNVFEDVNGAIYLNDSGGWDIPGSRFNNKIVIQGNTFKNAMMAINVWGASGRSCLNSGEGEANGESSTYCAGGFPQNPPDKQYFSHYYDTVVGELAQVVDDQACSAASPCSKVTLSDAPTLNDWIGFAGEAPDGNSNSSPAGTSTNDNTNVSTFTGSGTIHVGSTSGFPSSGQLLADTSAGQLYTATGAVVSYTGLTSTSFTGVKLVSGRGTLNGNVLAVQPHHVTAVTCPGGNCHANFVTVSVSPPITHALADGTKVYATGTCAYYVTTATTPSSPKAPNGTSYYDGCMWENRNISVTGNTFQVDATTFNATPAPEGGKAWNCTTGASGNCAQNAMGYQYPGSNVEPYSNVVLCNALMSSPSLPGLLKNLNASGSPLATGNNGEVGPNGEAPYNDLWTNNTYVGDWTFQAYTQAAQCPINWNGTTFTWVGGGGGGNACSGLSLAKWKSIWHQN